MDRFTEFSRRNRERCESPQGFNHPLGDWTLSDWMTAVVGEVGEAANVIKKLNRIRDGLGDRNRKGETEVMLYADLADELADAFTYLDLLAQSVGMDILEEAGRKFGQVSEGIGYPQEADLFTSDSQRIAAALAPGGGSDR